MDLSRYIRTMNKERKKNASGGVVLPTHSITNVISNGHYSLLSLPFFICSHILLSMFQKHGPLSCRLQATEIIESPQAAGGRCRILFQIFDNISLAEHHRGVMRAEVIYESEKGTELCDNHPSANKCGAAIGSANSRTCFHRWKAE